MRAGGHRGTSLDFLLRGAVLWLVLIVGGLPAGASVDSGRAITGTSIVSTNWSPSPAVTVPVPAQSQLTSVSCSRQAACTAAGSFYTASPYGEQGPRALTEQWSGGRWVPDPPAAGDPADKNGATSELAGVACTARGKTCVAVGTFDNGSAQQTFAEVGSGDSWVVTPTPNPTGASGSYLTGVACPSMSYCLAVGYSVTGQSGDPPSSALVEEWNGSTWTILSTPASSVADSRLNSISCVPGSTCVAVGEVTSGPNGSEPLAEVLQGTSWQLESPGGPNGGQLSGVACTSATSCVAVGAVNGDLIVALAMTWDGTSWTAQQVAVPAHGIWLGLSSVACASVSNCTAVGSYVDQALSGGEQLGLAERWNGSSWTFTATAASPPSSVGFAGVSEPYPTTSIAVGFQSPPRLNEQLPLTEQLAGSTWSVMATDEVPSWAEVADLASAACASPSSCVAVGHWSARLRSGVDNPLGEAWNGSSWQFTKIPTPPGRGNVDLTSVSCFSATSCVAVGSYDVWGGAPPAVLWNGARWTSTVVPLPPGAQGADLASVSCVPGSCIAVGTLQASGIPPLANAGFAERFDGSSWSLLASPTPPGQVASFSAISCASATSCMATGSVETFPTPDSVVWPVVAARWNGSTWAATSVPSAETTVFTGVSCPKPSWCLAVGRDTSKNQPVMDHWNGHTWVGETAPFEYPSNLGTALTVACRSTQMCVAVGRAGPSQWTNMAVLWDGSSWGASLVTPPPSDPIGVQENGALVSAACPAGGPCVAVGLNDNGAAFVEMAPAAATSVTASSATSVPGERVTYTATLRRDLGKPDLAVQGVIVFADNGVTIAACRANSGYVVNLTATQNTATVVCHVSYRLVGTHQIEAIFEGASDLLAATGVLRGGHHVVPGSLTATSLRASRNPAVVSDPVVFTASVSSSSTTYRSLPGSVQVTVRNSVGNVVRSCTVALPLADRVSCKVPAGTLRAGSYSVLARYLPSSRHDAPSTSRRLIEVVKA